jgi:septum formation protein
MIYLASKSPRRAELLRQIGVNFKILHTAIDESQLANETVHDYVCRMAETKVLCSEKNLAADVERLPILGADTIISIDGNIVGKPVDSNDCCSILTRLSARRHQVLSAVAMSYQGRIDLKVSVSQVTFRSLGKSEIMNYCADREPMDKAGAYAIQGKAAIFIEHMEGSYSSVMGLPLFETAGLLRQAGIAVLQS